MNKPRFSTVIRHRAQARTIAGNRLEAGFSLIELMVVTAIFVILSAVVLTSNSRFGSVIILRNLAHDIALAIREAQVYGIAVRGFGGGGVNQFGAGYGMHFSPGTGYELFADLNNDGIWSAGETVTATTIVGGFTIAGLCAPENSCGRDRVDILFKRPEPDACISVNGTVVLDADEDCTSSIQRAAITIQSPRGETATVVIDASGQISVQ
jgi:prepilin-type N-terminal cleavage/methylation domain-containing protein